MNEQLSDQAIFDVVLPIIVDALRIEPHRVTMEARIFTDLEAESIDIVDIRFRIEEAFGFKINQEKLIGSLGESLTRSEIEERFTVGALVAYVKSRLAEAKA